MIVVWLHVHKIGVVIFTPETAGTFGVRQDASIFHPGQSHGCCPVRATGGSLLQCGRYRLAPLIENEKVGRNLWYFGLGLHQLVNALYPPVGNAALKVLFADLPRWYSTNSIPSGIFHMCAPRVECQRVVENPRN